MEDNQILKTAIQELEEITTELKEIKRVKATLIEDLQTVKKMTGECQEILQGFHAISEEIKTSSEAMRNYAQRIESLNATLGSTIEEAKQIENRIMLEKMDLLISKAETIAKPQSKKSTVTHSEPKSVVTEEKNSKSVEPKES